MPKNKKFYLHYITAEGDKIVLSFRGQETLNEHIKLNKIFKNQIIEISNVRPESSNIAPNNSSIQEAINYF
ncbi:hypothetical protein NV379_01735 [Paenibacillus sp. N1-5-1-14]|uniref:hypothetical protein n=1 Tax=Paenibacillus radicibacter TaxID=2972488 RepID=UPI0021598C32|nr:hypothetical protein [Paenibacillus radicibacter]MCR8641366.1 hypothetical protein [Paenibacillus radicibacter]